MKEMYLAIDQFGASAPGEKIMEEYGFTVENVVARVKGYLIIQPRKRSVSKRRKPFDFRH